MEAEEAGEQLKIVQLFLPEAYHSDCDSVLVLLRFKRIAFKARLLHMLLKETVARPAPGFPGDRVLMICDALDKLTWVATTSDRFISRITHCSLEEFAKFESTSYDLEPIERTLNTFVEEATNYFS